MKDYNDSIKVIFDLISLNEKYKVIGSSTKDLYFSDYDLHSILNFKGKNQETKIYKSFKDIFKIANNTENVWITDFKVGEDSSGDPLRWNYKNMINNDNNGYTFQEALKQKSTIKIDIVFYLDGKFIEITDNYYFSINGYKTFNDMSMEEQKEQLIEKFYEYVNINAFMKALKRFRSISSLRTGGSPVFNTKNIKIIKILSDFFNSPIGFLYTLWSEISTIIQLIELEKKPPQEKIFNALQRIKEHLSFFDIKNDLDVISKMKNLNSIKNKLIKQNELINKYINKKSCIFVKTELFRK